MLKKVLKQLDLVSGSKIPWGYGVAYRDYARALYIAYPLPIAWLMRLWRRIYEYSVFYSNSQHDKDLTDARHEGFKEGLEAGKVAMIQQLENGLDSYLQKRKKGCPSNE